MDGLTVGFLACVGRSRGVVGMIEVARSPVEGIGGDDGNGRKGSEVVWRSGALSRNGAKMWPADGLLERVACVRCERWAGWQAIEEKNTSEERPPDHPRW